MAASPRAPHIVTKLAIAKRVVAKAAVGRDNSPSARGFHIRRDTTPATRPRTARTAPRYAHGIASIMKLLAGYGK